MYQGFDQTFGTLRWHYSGKKITTCLSEIVAMETATAALEKISKEETIRLRDMYVG